MSKHTIEITVEVHDEVVADMEDDESYRGTPDEWQYLSDIEWAEGIGAIDEDPSITGYEAVSDGS